MSSVSSSSSASPPGCCYDQPQTPPGASVDDKIDAGMIDERNLTPNGAGALRAPHRNATRDCWPAHGSKLRPEQSPVTGPHAAIGKPRQSIGRR
jgi:hypothetical protein